MRNKEDFIEKMKERGYLRVSETRNSKNEIISIHFIYNNLTDENKKKTDFHTRICSRCMA